MISSVVSVISVISAMHSRTRIVALGDSTTAGTPEWRSPLEAPPEGQGDETSQYAFWLMAMHPEWEVLNRGVDGQRSDQIRARFDRDVVDVRPRAVIVIAGVNDVYQGLPAEHVLEQLRWMYTRAKRAGVVVVAGTIVPYNTATADQNARMRQINDWILAGSDLPRDSAPDAVVDTRAAVAAPDNPDRLFESPDGLHPSPAGYRRMAEALRPALEQLLR